MQWRPSIVQIKHLKENIASVTKRIVLVLTPQRHFRYANENNQTKTQEMKGTGD